MWMFIGGETGQSGTILEWDFLTVDYIDKELMQNVRLWTFGQFADRLYHELQWTMLTYVYLSLVWSKALYSSIHGIVTGQSGHLCNPQSVFGCPPNGFNDNRESCGHQPKHIFTNKITEDNDIVSMGGESFLPREDEWQDNLEQQSRDASRTHWRLNWVLVEE